jgi:hypothetical protein
VMAEPMPPTNPALFRMVGLLDKFKKNGRGWVARCPAHEDRDPSLSINEGNDGRVLLKCHAGCSTDAVVAALGLTLSDLFEKRRDGGIIRRFKIVDRNGTLIARHRREDLPNGDKDMGWESGGRQSLNGIGVENLPLYGLPELLEAPAGSLVYVCEGETDTQALLDIGILAVGTVTGASSVPCGDSLAPLRDYDVVLWPDNDQPGRDHMNKIAATLNINGKPPRWLEWPPAPKGGGAADWVKTGGAADDLASLIRPWTSPQVPLAVVETPVSWNLISSTDLAGMVLPEQKWAVPGIVPEGVLLVAGKPKFGKSWWVFDLCTAIATGGKAWGRIAVERGEVLYITYEDSYRRLQDRQQRLAGHDRGVPGLDFVTDCPRSDQGGIDLVLDWVQKHPRARLIVIDPLEYWRPQEDTKKQLYRQDYDSLRPIVEAARSLGISVIVVHHCNKMPNPDDPFDAISGTTGLQGVADAIGVFRKEHGMADAVLFIKGKDVDAAELAYKTRISDAWPAPAWELLGSGEEYRLSRERFDVLTALWREPWQTPASLAELMDPPVQKGTMRKRLFDMAHDGLVRISDGKYAPGISEDLYLDKYGHHDVRAGSNNGNAGNAVTPVTPVRIEDENPPIENEQESGVTPVTAVTAVTSVTPVTTSPPPANTRPLSHCLDCKQVLEGASFDDRCARCYGRKMEEDFPL